MEFEEPMRTHSFSLVVGIAAVILAAALVWHGKTGALDAGPPVLNHVVDVPLPGRATRFDYQSLDPKTGRLYMSHMGDGHLVVFDTKTNKVIADLDGLPLVTGVLFVPDL